MKIVSLIERISEWFSNWLAIILFIEFALIFVDMLARYAFNHPIEISWELSGYLNCTIVLLAGGYVYLKNGHVPMDVFSSRWSASTRRIVDIATAGLFFFAFAVIMYFVVKDAIWSIGIKEVSVSSTIRMPLYPVRILICIGIFLFFIAGIAKFFKLLWKHETVRTITVSD